MTNSKKNQLNGHTRTPTSRSYNHITILLKHKSDQSAKLQTEKVQPVTCQLLGVLKTKWQYTQILSTQRPPLIRNQITEPPDVPSPK